MDNLRTRFAQERSSGAEQINILNETIDQLVEAKDVERFDLREKIANLQVECQRLQTNMETKDSQILSLGKKLADAESIKV